LDVYKIRVQSPRNKISTKWVAHHPQNSSQA
jgi:hypothetical protein